MRKLRYYDLGLIDNDSMDIATSVLVFMVTAIMDHGKFQLDTASLMVFLPLSIPIYFRSRKNGAKCTVLTCNLCESNIGMLEQIFRVKTQSIFQYTLCRSSYLHYPSHMLKLTRNLLPEKTILSVLMQ